MLLHRLRTLTACALVLSSAFAKLSEANEADGFASYLREAMGANPDLASQYRSWLASKQIGTQVGALPDPRLTYTEFVSQVETRTGPQERVVLLSQAFPWPGKLFLNRGIADQNAEAAFYQYESLQRKIVRDLGLVFYDYAFLGEATIITKENLRLLQQLTPVVEEKVRGGGDLSASLRLEVETTRMEDQLQTLTEQRPAVSSALASMLGRSPDLSQPLPWPTLGRSIPEIGDESALEAAVQAHPMITASEKGLLSAELAEKLARKSSLPDLNLGANVIDIGDGGETGVGVVVGVNIPIRFNKYRAEREEARERVEAAKEDVESVRLELVADLHAAIQRFREADKRVRLYRSRLLPAAEQALELTEESYRNDKASITDVIDSERTLLDLRITYVRALASAQKAAVEVRALTEPVASASK